MNKWAIDSPFAGQCLDWTGGPMEVHPSMHCLLNTSQMVHGEHISFCASYAAYITFALHGYILPAFINRSSGLKRFSSSVRSSHGSPECGIQFGANGCPQGGIIEFGLKSCRSDYWNHCFPAWLTLKAFVAVVLGVLWSTDLPRPSPQFQFLDMFCGKAQATKTWWLAFANMTQFLMLQMFSLCPPIFLAWFT